MSLWSDLKSGNYTAVRGTIANAIAGRTSGLKIHPSTANFAASEFSHIVSSFNIRRDWGRAVPGLHQSIGNHYQRVGKSTFPPQMKP